MPAHVLADCCLEVAFDAEPELVLQSGDTDPFTGAEVGWPYPVVYWSNGAVTAGSYAQSEETP